MDTDNITHEQETGYARRPHRKEKDNSSNLKIRNILNIIFMLLAIVGVAIYLLKQTFWGTIIIECLIFQEEVWMQIMTIHFYREKDLMVR